MDGPEPRFLCDAMLRQLGHWLRAAGNDTLVAEDRTSDRALLARALGDRRALLTRDRQLFALAGTDSHVLLLRGERLPDLVAQITPRFGIDWLARPFSRCLVCNVVLRPAAPLARSRLPQAVLDRFEEINHCPQCDRLYWAGGHVRRMRERLARWHAGDFG